MSNDATDAWYGPEGGPLTVLFEREDFTGGALPEPLSKAYGGGLGFPGPRVLANFVVSLDGVVALPIAAESGHEISLANEADRFVMGLLRALADVILVGAGTLRKSSDAAYVSQTIYPPAAPHFAALRARLGLAPHPRLVVVTGSGDLDLTSPALASATLVTTQRGADVLRKRSSAGVDLMVHEGETVSLPETIAQLRARGANVILTEGGPSLFAELLQAKLLDELFLTTSPALFGRRDGDGRKSLVFGDVAGTTLDLVSLRRHGSHLFSRYVLKGG